MNHIGNTHYIFYQDSSLISKESMPVKQVDAGNINLDVKKPVLKAIPETPRRFKKVIAEVKSEDKVFIPSSEDSIRFNLINRSVSEQGVIENTVVYDFLHPMSRGDKQWINSGFSSEFDSVQVATLKEEISELKSDTSIISDSLKVENDSINIGNDADSFSVSNVKTERAQTPKSSERKEGMEVNVSSENPVVLQNHSKDVVTSLLILSVAIIGVIRMTNNKYLSELFSAILFSQSARKMQKTSTLRNQKAAFVLNALFLFNTSIFLYQFVNYYKINTLVHQSLLLIPIAMAIILSYGLIKSGLYLFVGFVFDSEKETKDYLYFSGLHNKIFAIIILPIILVVPYIERQMLPVLFYIGFGSFVLLYFLQLFRGIAIILKNTASLFYMFLYLCALEILPLIIMYNVLIR